MDIRTVTREFEMTTFIRRPMPQAREPYQRHNDGATVDKINGQGIIDDSRRQSSRHLPGCAQFFLDFVGDEHLQQRLIGNVALVCQDLEPLDHGLR